MKKYSMILGAMFMAISFTACSQSKVPEAVKTAFNKKFPAAKKVVVINKTGKILNIEKGCEESD